MRRRPSLSAEVVSHSDTPASPARVRLNSTPMLQRAEPRLGQVQRQHHGQEAVGEQAHDPCAEQQGDVFAVCHAGVGLNISHRGAVYSASRRLGKRRSTRGRLLDERRMTRKPGC